MRKMTLEEFKKFLQQHYDMAGITEEEEEIYYMMYEVGRQSVRWWLNMDKEVKIKTDSVEWDYKPANVNSLDDVVNIVK